MTIEEMAIQFANEMYGEYNTSNIVENGWPKAKSFYEQGANAVLEEIEAVLNKGNESRCADFFTIAEIKRKIEQLKK